jgi:hypothetical protein
MSHNWTWDEINADWLSGNRLALSQAEVVAAFNRAEHILGSRWIEKAALNLPGTSSTLRVASVGQRLSSLDGASGTEELVSKLQANDDSAFAELTAAHLLKSRCPNSHVEFGPVVQVGSRKDAAEALETSIAKRKPDFRVRQGTEPWTYVEVTQPRISKSQAKAETILSRLGSLVYPIPKGFSLEIFLRREPSAEEIDALAKFIREFCLLDGKQTHDMPELAILSLNASAPTEIVPLEHPGEPKIPRLGRADLVSGPGEPNPRHISVRMAYADDRAKDVLSSEARQLPTDSPGLIMVQMAWAPGGIRSWEPSIIRRFQPTIHTRVSAICLFRSGHEGTPDGAAWIHETKLIVNPHAYHPLPAWITDVLSKVQRHAAGQSGAL